MNGPVLRVHLSAGYGKQTLLQDLQFELRAGERLGLLGPSGTGKSTLLLALLGLLPLRGGWVDGEVWLQGQNLLALRSRQARSLRGRVLALVPQSPLNALNPALKLRTHFEQAWKAHGGANSEVLRTRVEDLLRRVALPTSREFLERRPTAISVGQAQRCTLTLALLHRPSLLIADEPTSALDPATQAEVIDLLRQITEEEQTALLFVSHDLLSVLRLCSSVAVLAEKRLTEHLAVEDIVLAQDVTLRRLLATLPVPAEIIVQHARRETRKGAATSAGQDSRSPAGHVSTELQLNSAKPAARSAAGLG